MKINGKPDAAGGVGVGGLASKLATGQTTGAEKTKAGEDQGSAVAKLSGKFNDIKAGDAPFDAAKVEQIKQAIKNGEFEVNPEAIADKIIASAKELTGQV